MYRFIILLFFSISSFSQEVTLTNTNSLDADTFIGVDTYKNTYYIKDNVIFKTGDLGFFEFNDLQLGDITSVDIINPLKVVVYYHDFNTVVFLDNRLSEIERIDFNELPNFINTGAATNAGNNRLWLLNTDTQQIELFNYSAQITTLISQPITDNIKGIASNFNFIYVLTDQELKQFNIYGAIMDSFKISEGEKISQNDGNIIIKTPSTLMYKSKAAKEFIALENLEILEVDLQLHHDLVYIYNGEKLTTFSLNQPKN